MTSLLVTTEHSICPTTGIGPMGVAGLKWQKGRGNEGEPSVGGRVRRSVDRVGEGMKVTDVRRPSTFHVPM